jgi:hypothetical protein
MLRTALLGFIAGALGVLIFHQGFVAILYAAGGLPIAPYSFAPTHPFNVPEVLSLAFWGGIWGIALIVVMERVPGANGLWVAFLFGGILPPLVGALIVTPLKGGTVADWLEWRHIVFGFLINAVWGLGTALVYRAERRMASAPA